MLLLWLNHSPAQQHPSHEGPRETVGWVSSGGELERSECWFKKVSQRWLWRRAAGRPYRGSCGWRVFHLKERWWQRRKSFPRRIFSTLLPSPLQNLGGVGWLHSFDRLHANGQMVPPTTHALLFCEGLPFPEEFPGITVQMVLCNKPSGVSGLNASPQRDSH